MPKSRTIQPPHPCHYLRQRLPRRIVLHPNLPPVRLYAASQPLPLNLQPQLPPVQGKPVFKLLNTKDHLIFTLERDRSGRLLAIEHRTYAQLAYDTAVNAFILGQPAEQIRDMLLGYGQAPYQDCLIGDHFNLCPAFLYLQGLSYELSGDETEAVATYLQLWRTYPDSPYFFIICAKLES